MKKKKKWTHLGNFTFSESYILKSKNKTGDIHFNKFIYPNSSKILTFQCIVNIKNSNNVILYYFFILLLSC